MAASACTAAIAAWIWYGPGGCGAGTPERFSVVIWTAQLQAELLKFVSEDRLYRDVVADRATRTAPQ